MDQRAIRCDSAGVLSLGGERRAQNSLRCLFSHRVGKVELMVKSGCRFYVTPTWFK